MELVQVSKLPSDGGRGGCRGCGQKRTTEPASLKMDQCFITFSSCISRAAHVNPIQTAAVLLVKRVYYALDRTP